MYKRLSGAALVLAMLSALPAMAEESVASKFKLQLGGYIKLDYAHNSNAVGPISPGAPGGGIPPIAAGSSSKDESVFTAKQSRLWLKVSGPEFNGAKTGALVEMDFYGFGALSNEFANLRMRHAYGTLDWANTQVLFGQYWDVFGGGCADTVDFRLGGTTGNPASPRVPQVRVTHRVDLGADNAVRMVIAAQNPTEDAAAPGSNSMSKTGGYGSAVNGAGLVSFTSKALGVSPGYMGLGNSPLTITLFGEISNEKLTPENEVTPWGYGVYGLVPIMASKDGKSRAMTMTLEAQAYMAAGIDVQGATAMSLVGTTKQDAQPARGYGLFGQLKFYPTQELGVNIGYGRRESLDVDKAKATSAAVLALSNAPYGPERYNELMYANVSYDLNPAIRVATELERMHTGYATTQGQNNTVRVAAYYFF